ncbi:uncharacterized protein JCM15063_001212 [Sporobolomyces koalae]|uniref:uncharacterized protein n=1 Tax=Sporobolomyces koalae TaxID=500713 RepID=UPI003179DA2F
MSQGILSQADLAHLLDGGSNGGDRRVTVLKQFRKLTVGENEPSTSAPAVLSSSSGNTNSCPIHIRFLGSVHGPCTCPISDILRGITGHAANSNYLSQVEVPSRPVKAEFPLVVISLDGLLAAHLPVHFIGGYTEYIKRAYLKTFISYLLLRHAPWCFVFWTSKPREEGLKILKELNLPTGGPEDDERDDVLGLFAAEDMSKWRDSPHPVKDLEYLWTALYQEEGVQFGVHNTVVLTHDPQEMAKQPYNFIHLPTQDYKSAEPQADDLVLLLMIAVLRDLETETNFANHIKEMGWNTLEIWTAQLENLRNEILYNAVRICAMERISIRAFTGNKRDAA